MKKINPGDSRREVLSRDNLNRLIASEPRVSKQTPVGTFNSNVCIDTMLADDSSATEVRPYDIVKFWGARFFTPDSSPNNPGELMAKGYHYTETDKYGFIWGIAQDWITKTKSAPVLIAGVSHLYTDNLTLPTANDYLQYFDLYDRHVYFGFNGRATVINRPTKPYSIVLLSQTQQILKGRTFTTPLVSGVPGLVKLQVPTGLYSGVISTPEIQMPCISNIGGVAIDKNVLLYPINGIWEVVEVCTS
jgi:hypothetical protein